MTYRQMRVPILDQGTEGACTGFGLATVVHYLLRTRDVIRDDEDVSPRMLYDMARRYDEWPGEEYSGSSARGAMKGWHKHGVCSRPHWIYDLNREKQDRQALREAFRRCAAAATRLLLPCQSQGPRSPCTPRSQRSACSTPPLRCTKGGRTSGGRRHQLVAGGADRRRARVRDRGLRRAAASGSRTRGQTTGARTDSRRSSTTTGSSTAATSGSPV